MANYLAGVFIALGIIAAQAQGIWLPQDMLNDTSTLNLQTIRQWTELVGVQQVQMVELRYDSWECVDGQLQTIPIHAFYARPTSLSYGAAVVLAHGLTVLFAFGNGC